MGQRLRCPIALPVQSLEMIVLNLNLETDFQDLAIVADEPSGVGIRECDGPEAVRAGNGKPGAAFVGSPRCGTGTEIRFGLGGNHHRTVELGIESSAIATTVVRFVATAKTVT